MRKVKPFIHILSNFHEFLSTLTPSAAAVNRSGSEAHFEETQDQLSPRHFENAGSNLFFYVECSYLVNISPNHLRICWYKKNYSPKYFSPAYVPVSESGVFSKLPPTAISYLNVYWRRKSTNLFGYDWNLQHTMCWCQHKYVPKIIKFRGRIPQKTTRGDNWPAAITGRLPVDIPAIASSFCLYKHWQTIGFNIIFAFHKCLCLHIQYLTMIITCTAIITLFV